MLTGLISFKMKYFFSSTLPNRGTKKTKSILWCNDLFRVANYQWYCVSKKLSLYIASLYSNHENSMPTWLAGCATKNPIGKNIHIPRPWCIATKPRGLRLHWILPLLSNRFLWFPWRRRCLSKSCQFVTNMLVTSMCVFFCVCRSLRFIAFYMKEKIIMFKAKLTNGFCTTVI